MAFLLMKHFCLFFLGISLLCSALFLNSCSTDFDPNAEWKETTLVYGLLDQDDENSYLRIQKCFLGEGNMYGFAKIEDSNCYAPDELRVLLTEWTTTYSGSEKVPNQPTGKAIEFEYTELNTKPDGEFFSPNQPYYFSKTKGSLSSDKIYKIEITNLKSGNVVNSQTTLIPNGISITVPFTFRFTGTKENPYFSVQWSTATVKEVRMSQPVFRFYYNEEGTRKKLDLTRAMARGTSFETKLTQNEFGSFLKATFANDKNPKTLFDSMDVYIMAASENLSTYIDNSKPQTGLVQERPTYSNIDNGIGIFASRRQNIYRRLPVDNSVFQYVHGLDIGF